MKKSNQFHFDYVLLSNTFDERKKEEHSSKILRARYNVCGAEDSGSLSVTIVYFAIRLRFQGTFHQPHTQNEYAPAEHKHTNMPWPDLAPSGRDLEHLSLYHTFFLSKRLTNCKLTIWEFL